MKQQKLEGRIVTRKSEIERHKKLVAQINSIIDRARDSTLMDIEYDAHLIKELFKCEPIKVTLPENEWEHLSQQGANPDRKLIVTLYIDKAKASLKRQGLLVSNGNGED